MPTPISIPVPFLPSWVYGVSDIPVVLDYSECLTKAGVSTCCDNTSHCIALHL